MDGSSDDNEINRADMEYRKRTAEHVFAWLEGAGKVGPWNMTM